MTSPLRPLLLTFILLHSSFILSQAAPPPELTVLRMQYDKLLAERVTAPFEASLAELNTKFTAALTNATNAAKQAGKLDEVLAIQDDQKRLADKLPLPDDTDTTPEALKRLRAIYREQLGKLEAQRTANHGTILPAYTARLQELETTLTKADRIDEAKELKIYREGLTQGGADASSSAASGPARTNMPPAALAGASAPPSGAAPRVKGDDRKAAEWLIKVGGKFEIDERGRKSHPAKPEDLPKGRFTIINIGLDGRNTKEPITADGLANLRGLEGVTGFNSGQLSLTESDFAFIPTMPALEYVTFGPGTQINDDVVDLLVPLNALKQLKVTDVKEFTGATLGKLAGIKTLATFEFTGTGFSAAGAEAVSQLKQIRGMLLEHSHSLTDEGLLHLARLPALARLHMSNSGCTAEGLAAARLKVINLDFNKLSGKLPRETAPVVGPACPGVTNVRLSLSDDLKQEDFQALASFKSLRSLFIYAVNDTSAWAGLSAIKTLEDITFDRNPFSDAELDHLLNVPTLASLTFINVDVTDAGLLKLAAMKKLKRIYLKPCPKVTDAGITALKKKCPDIQISR